MAQGDLSPAPLLEKKGGAFENYTQRRLLNRSDRMDGSIEASLLREDRKVESRGSRSRGCKGKRAEAPGVEYETKRQSGL